MLGVGGGRQSHIISFFQPAENTKLQKEIQVITDMLRLYSIFVFFTQYWQMTPGKHFSWIPLWSSCLSFVCIMFTCFGRCALNRFLACVMFCVDLPCFTICYRAVWSWWSHNILKKGVLIRGGFQRQCQKTNYFILFPLADDKYARCVDFLSMSFLFPVGHFLVHLLCFIALWSWELIPCVFSL